MPGSAPTLSAEARDVLALLRAKRCVLVSGIPSAGKTRLLNEVAAVFGGYRPPGPQSNPAAAMPVQAGGSVDLRTIMPSPEKTDRGVFPMTISPSTQYRHCWREIEVDPTAQGTSFRTSQGRMWAANEHALAPKGASLLILDEFNRGPIVNLLGPALGAIEGDKRRDYDSNAPIQSTVEFALPDDAGVLEDYSLSAHLYILAAMNNADVSVETIDAATLRRFEPFALPARPDVLARYLNVVPAAPVPASAASATDVYAALLAAWQQVNERIAIGRGDNDHGLGHGSMMSDAPPPTDLAEAIGFARHKWAVLTRHVTELFFGDVDAQAAVLGVFEPGVQHPYTVDSAAFGIRTVDRLVAPDLSDDATMFAALRATAGIGP